MLSSDENALFYIKSYFDESVDYKREFYGCYRVILPDGELFVSAAMGEVTVKDYDQIDEKYRLTDPTHFAPYERIG